MRALAYVEYGRRRLVNANGLSASASALDPSEPGTVREGEEGLALPLALNTAAGAGETSKAATRRRRSGAA